MKETAIGQKVMLGFLYPAVLGAALYAGLQAVVDPVAASVAAIFGEVRPASASLPDALKLTLYGLSVTFYLCDYFYIMFTKSYKVWFFIADCIFVVVLYATILCTHVWLPGEPRLSIIAICYAAFFALYLKWTTMSGAIQRMTERRGITKRFSYGRRYRWSHLWLWVPVYSSVCEAKPYSSLSWRPVPLRSCG